MPCCLVLIFDSKWIVGFKKLFFYGLIALKYVLLLYGYSNVGKLNNRGSFSIQARGQLPPVLMLAPPATAFYSVLPRSRWFLLFDLPKGGDSYCERNFI